MDELEFLSEEFIDGFPYVARNIFRHLDVANLNRCRLVSKKWKTTIESDQYFWDACFDILENGLLEIEKNDYRRFKTSNEVVLCTAQDWCDLYGHLSETKETFDEMVDYVVFLQNYFYYGRAYSDDSPLNYAARIGNMSVIKLCMERNFNFNKPYS